MPLGLRLPDAGGNFFLPAAPQVPQSPSSTVTGYPLPQQRDPIINKSFLDPPLPRAPSGTLAAAAAADLFQKGGVATARCSAGSVPGLKRGRGQAAVTGQERTLRTCARSPLAEVGHTPASGLGRGGERAWPRRSRPYRLLCAGARDLSRPGGRCEWVEGTGLGSARWLAPVRAPIQAAGRTCPSSSR